MSSSIENEPPVERVREALKKPADVLGLRGNVWYLPGYLGEKNNDEKFNKGGVLLFCLVTYNHSHPSRASGAFSKHAYAGLFTSLNGGQVLHKNHSCPA